MRQRYKTIDNWQLIINKLSLSLYHKKHIIIKLQVGKIYRVKNDIFNFKAGEVWSLVREGYQ